MAKLAQRWGLTVVLRATRERSSPIAVWAIVSRGTHAVERRMPVLSPVSTRTGRHWGRMPVFDNCFTWNRAFAAKLAQRWGLTVVLCATQERSGPIDTSGDCFTRNRTAPGGRGHVWCRFRVDQSRAAHRMPVLTIVSRETLLFSVFSAAWDAAGGVPIGFGERGSGLLCADCWYFVTMFHVKRCGLVNLRCST